MSLQIPEKELEAILSDSALTNITARDLSVGDHVVMNVGTYCGDDYKNNDWRWIRGFVKRLTQSMRVLPGRTELDTFEYTIIHISQFENRFLRQILPSLRVDQDQPPNVVSYDRILRYNK